MQAELAALVGSRICHDLISPIGAINNGVELLALTGGTEGEEMALIKQSVETASARIKFFRIAFGAADDGQSVSAKEVRSILAPLSMAGRVAHEWGIEGDLPRMHVRCVFLMIQALESALPLGGTISATQTDEGILLNGTGRRINHDTALWDGPDTTSPSGANAASQVHFTLLPEALRAAGLTAKVTASEADIKVQL